LPSATKNEPKEEALLQTRFDIQIIFMQISIPQASLGISSTKKPDTFVSGL